MPGRNFPLKPDAKAADIRRLLAEGRGVRETARIVGVKHPYVSHLAIREGLRKPIRVAPTQNPWGLTVREEQCLNILAESGSTGVVAEKLGLNIRTVEKHLRKARAHMGETNTMVAVVQFDRWRMTVYEMVVE